MSFIITKVPLKGSHIVLKQTHRQRDAYRLFNSITINLVSYLPFLKLRPSLRCHVGQVGCNNQVILREKFGLYFSLFEINFVGL
jgi:hypothetical protein